MTTLQEYYDMKGLSDYERKRRQISLINKLLDNEELLRDDIQDMLECFISDLGNADFIRLCDTINAKVKRG